jgi:hypothetical protein
VALSQLAEGVSAPRISSVIPLTPQVIRKIGHRYEQGGLERALYEKQRPGAAKVLDDSQKLRIIAMVCSDPPEGRARWTVRLVVEEAGYAFAQSAPMTPALPQLDTASPGIRAARGAYFDHIGEGMGKLEDRDPNAPADPPIMATPPPNKAEFPGDLADVILIGTITGVQAFQSNNHGAIYTESTIRVEQVIDRTAQTAGQTKPGATITLIQTGGALQLPNGRILKQTVIGHGNELQREICVLSKVF